MCHFTCTILCFYYCFANRIFANNTHEYVGLACGEFAYHMRGSTMGDLQLLYVNGNNHPVVLWTTSGNRADHWLFQRVSLVLTGGDKVYN